MRLRRSPLLAALVLAVLAHSTLHAAKPVADIVPPEKRRATVQIAERIVQLPAPESVPADTLSPFNPASFAQPDSTETRDTRAGAGTQGKVTAVDGPKTDREVLAAVAARIPTTGTIVLGGKPLLISGVNRIEVGSHFTVVYNGQEFELELTAIDRTTFTVRYRGEEFTRPIKQGKSP